MARNYLTSLNLNKNELLNARIQNLANAPTNPVAGQIYFDTALDQLRVFDGIAWLSLAAGGNVTEAITAAIDALDTDDIEEGVSNLYYTESRAKTDAAELLTGATLTNITITGDGSGLTITAENGVADSDTDDLTEGATNLYFTEGRARAAINAGTGIDYNSATGYIDANLGTGLGLDGTNQIEIDRTTVDAWYDASGAAASAQTAAESYADGLASNYDPAGSAGGVQSNLNTHINDSSAHGTTGNVVGDTDAQTLTNKTLGSGTVLSADVDANGNTITDLGDPTVDSDAVPKGYLDLTLGNHASDTSTHGVGTIVGTSEAQTLTNKTLGSGNVLSADLDADEFKVINLATPTAPGDAANKAYVDNAVAGLTWKPAVHLLATSNVALTGDSDTLVIDGHASLDASSVGYRILLTAQSTDTENGIYVYADDSVTYTLTRAADSDVYTELKGATVFVQEGTTYGQSAWTQGNTYLTSFADQDWVQFSGAAQIVAGHGLTKTGNTLDVVGTADRITANADSIDIASTYAGQSSITTLGTIATGVWNGTDIAVADGGTGASTAAGARANLGATTKYTEANAEMVPSSGVVTWTVTHNLGIRTVLVQVYDLTGFEEVEVDIERTNTSTVTLSWVSSTTVAANSYQVVIIG